jgi:YggT family protein
MSNHAVDLIESFVIAFSDLFILVILLYIVMLWLRLPYNVWIDRVRTYAADTALPWLSLFRRFMPMVGGLDLSPMVATLAIYGIQQILLSILDGFRPGS